MEECGCTKPEPMEPKKNPQIGDRDYCRNCGHLVYYQYTKRWEHYTRAYRPYGYPYTSIKCHAPVNRKKG